MKDSRDCIDVTCTPYNLALLHIGDEPLPHLREKVEQVAEVRLAGGRIDYGLYRDAKKG